MNREMRRLMEKEERRQKKQQQKDGGKKRPQPTSAGRGRPGEPRQPLWKRFVTFLHEVRVELRKVSWPTRDQMIAFTTVTVITSVALTLVVFGLDVALKEVVLFVIGGA